MVGQRLSFTRRSGFKFSSFILFASTAALSSCAQNSAFEEKAQNISSEDLKKAQASRDVRQKAESDANAQTRSVDSSVDQDVTTGSSSSNKGGDAGTSPDDLSTGVGDAVIPGAGGNPGGAPSDPIHNAPIATPDQPGSGVNDGCTPSEDCSGQNPNVPPVVVVPPTPENPPVVVVPPTPENPPVVVVPPTPENPPVVVVPPTPENPPVVVVPPTPENPPVVVVPPTPENPPVVVPNPPLPVPKAGAKVAVNMKQNQARIDILWVVDSSGSMKWAQDKLAEKFETFALKLKEAKVDFQIGVTTTDVCRIDAKGKKLTDEHCPDPDAMVDGTKVGGRWIGPQRGEFIIDSESGQKILTPDMKDFVKSFKNLATVGTSGSGIEHGLTAARFALEKSMNGINEGKNSRGEKVKFLRPGVPLSIIILSDEEDNALEAWCQDAWGNFMNTAGKIVKSGTKDISRCVNRDKSSSPFRDSGKQPSYALSNKGDTGKPWTKYKFSADDFLSFMKNDYIKGEGQFRVNAITGMRDQPGGKIVCDRSTVPVGEGPTESGTNYIKASQLTKGIVENICNASWATLLANIGKNTVELASKVDLPKGKIPFPGTLKVWVNGQLWENKDSSQYYFEEKANAVVFKQIPLEGSQISIEYRETSFE